MKSRGEGNDGGGGDDRDDGNDGGDEEVNVEVEEQAQDSDSDDGLAGYVNAEDDEAWFAFWGDAVWDGEVLFRGDYQKGLDELPERIAHLAQALDQQTEEFDAISCSNCFWGPYHLGTHGGACSNPMCLRTFTGCEKMFKSPC